MTTEAEKQAAADKAAQKVKVRVLSATAGFAANDVALLSEAEAKAAVAAGWADDATAAVEYCEKDLGAEAREPAVELPDAPAGEAEGEQA